MGYTQLSPFGLFSQARNIVGLHQESCYVGKVRNGSVCSWYVRASSFVSGRLFEPLTAAFRFATLCMISSVMPSLVQNAGPNPHIQSRVEALTSPLDPSKP
jgi:hypothetical protein